MTKSLRIAATFTLASVIFLAPLARADARRDRRGLLRLRGAWRAALLARRVDDRVCRHHRGPEAEPAAQRALVGPCRRLPRAVGADDRAAVVEQPEMEPGRQVDRVPVGAAGGRRCRKRHAAHAGLAAAARRRRAAAPDESPERRFQLPVVPRRHPPRRRQPQRAERYREVAERCAALQARELQVQRQRLVRRQARAPVGRRGRVGPLDAADLRRRLERQRSAVVARRHEDRVRLGPERQGVRREPGHGRLGDRRERRTADEDLRSHERRQLAAVVARRPDDRVHQLGAGNRAPEDLARAERRRRRRRGSPPTASI